VIQALFAFSPQNIDPVAGFERMIELTDYPPIDQYLLMSQQRFDFGAGLIF
jgi:hypothetical protein